jgi:hypothetical protein
MKSYWDGEKKSRQEAEKRSIDRLRHDKFIKELQDRLMEKLEEDSMDNIMLEYKGEIIEYALKECGGIKKDLPAFLKMARGSIAYVQSQIMRFTPSKVSRAVITYDTKHEHYFIPLGPQFMFKSLQEAKIYFEEIGRYDWSPVKLTINMSDVVNFKEKTWNEETSYEYHQAHRKQKY